MSSQARLRPDLRTAAPAGDAWGLLDGLTAAQRVAVTSEGAPLCVLAGAGAGKTRVLTRRIAYRCAEGSAEAAHTLVITFTRKAASELGHRLGELGLRDRVQAGTFHAVAAAQVRQWWADRRVTPPTLLERKGALLASLASGRPGLVGVPVAQLAGHLEWAKARLVAPEDFEAAVAAAGRSLPAPGAALAALYRRFEDEKRRRGLVDFDDLLARCADAFESDPGFASAQRWRWRHLFVDEFQDVNPLQHRLLTAWMGHGTDLCVVGDPNQAVYGWNGADPRLLSSIAERWPGATVVRLEDNHRCSPQVVAAAAAVLGDDGRGLRSSRPDGPAVTVRSFADDDAEAGGVAADLLGAHADGVPWGQMAVLVRTNAQVGALSDALGRAGVPHVAPGRGGLADDPAAASVLAFWRRHPTTRLQVAVTDLTTTLADPAAAGLDDAGAAALSILADLARDHDRLAGPGTVGSLLDWLATAAAERPGNGDAVTVCSFHRAKGLEWHSVWVCGLEDGLVPIGRATSSEAVDEERRLLYVAMTRAGTALTCTWARARRFGPRPVPRTPSRWLEAVQAAGAVGDVPESRRPADVLDAAAWRARLAEQRRQLGTAAGDAARQRAARRPGPDRVRLPVPDGETLDALRSWRAGVARASGVPAHAVLHDRTLEALAGLRPASFDELLTVPGIGPVKATRFAAALLGLLTTRRLPA